MIPTKRILLGVLFTLLPLTTFAQPKIYIALHENTPLEEKGRKQLVRLIEEYGLDIDRWIFTDKVLIQSYEIPHSHPVLTLNTQYLDNDQEQLATFLHEQIHWYADIESNKTEEIIDVFKKMYPTVPVGKGEGARSEYSTYLHLMVCWLEFDAVRKLIDEETARSLLADKSYYRWIYKKVLEDTESIGKVLHEHEMVIG